MKRIVIWLLIIVFCFGMGGCGRWQRSRQHEITNPAGGTVEVPNYEIHRIVSLSPFATEVLIDIGKEDALVAVDDASAKLLTQERTLPIFDRGNPDRDELALLNADIIFVSGAAIPNDSTVLSAVQTMGADIIWVAPNNSLQEIRENVLFVANAVNRLSQGKELVTEMDRALLEMQEAVMMFDSVKTVYMEFGEETSVTFGNGVLWDDVLRAMYTQNAFAENKGWFTVTPPQIAAANPDVVFIVSKPVRVFENTPEYHNLKAVRAGAVYEYDLPLEPNNYEPLANGSHRIVTVMRHMIVDIYAGVDLQLAA